MEFFYGNFIFESAFCRIFDGMLEIGGSPFYGKILFFSASIFYGIFQGEFNFPGKQGDF